MVTVATFNVKDFFDSPKNAPVLREKARVVALVKGVAGQAPVDVQIEVEAK